MIPHIKDIIEWDVPNWSQLVKFWSPSIDAQPRTKKVLAIGERNGGLSAWLALKGFDVLCTDRMGPTEDARSLHQRLGIADKVAYRQLDILQCADETEKFDMIIAKSVIGGLKAEYDDRTTRSFDVQQRAVDNIYRLLNDGGYFFSAENMRGCLLMDGYRRRAGKNYGWRYLDTGEIDILYSRFRHKDVQSFGIFPTLFHNDVINTFSFRLNRILQFLPHSYKYISFVAARK
jgi:SAM-dependent methyltransferase